MAKCSKCGYENPDELKVCDGCGNIIDDGKKSRNKNPDETSGSDKIDSNMVLIKQIVNQLKVKYLRPPTDEKEKIINSLIGLISLYQERGMSLRNVLDEAAKIIFRMGIREVIIGLKDPKDGLYKHEAFAGYRKDLETLHKKITYTEAEFFNENKFRGINISDHIMIFLAEEQPHSNEVDKTFSRPSVLKKEIRQSTEDSLEGDYFEIHIYGRHQELIGWIEMSGTKTGKIPEIGTFKLVELIAMILGIIIEREMSKKRGT